MQKWHKKFTAKPPVKPANKETTPANYAAIDLGTNSCRLVIATPTPSSFRIVETFSKITRLGEGIINNNELSKPAIKRSLALCSHRRLPSGCQLQTVFRNGQKRNRFEY